MILCVVINDSVHATAFEIKCGGQKNINDLVQTQRKD